MFLIMVVFLILPAVLLVLLFRTLASVVDGLRAINATNLRVARAVETLVSEAQARADG